MNNKIIKNKKKKRKPGNARVVKPWIDLGDEGQKGRCAVTQLKLQPLAHLLPVPGQKQGSKPV
jgi:hypothetical protein